MVLDLDKENSTVIVEYMVFENWIENIPNGYGNIRNDNVTPKRISDCSINVLNLS